MGIIPQSALLGHNGAMNADVNTLPIGVFDSGVGGLTVLKALREELPRENLIYLGDTARLPYGSKSPATVQRYAVQAARILVDRGVRAESSFWGPRSEDCPLQTNVLT